MTDKLEIEVVFTDKTPIGTSKMGNKIKQSLNNMPFVKQVRTKSD